MKPQLFRTPKELRAWYEANHDGRSELLVGFWKKATGKESVTYQQALDEALCYGWIDSTYRRIDHERGALWWAPRRKGSVWAASNRARVARLEAEGRLAESGRAAVERAKADGSWSLLEPVEALIVPHDLAAALDARDGARQQWETLPPTAKRAYLLWVATAKRASTREARVNETAAAVAGGRRLDER